MRERFWSKVDCSGECWLWTGATSGRNNYGYFGYGKRVRRAHRVAFEMERGPIPNGLIVCHACDTPKCVRPSHLFLGTPADNTRDMVQKGRARGGVFRGEAHPTHKLTAADVLRIREAIGSGRGHAAVARDFGVSRGAIRAIATGQTWQHV
jgi:hypothetical protein